MKNTNENRQLIINFLQYIFVTKAPFQLPDKIKKFVLIILPIILWLYVVCAAIFVFYPLITGPFILFFAFIVLNDAPYVFVLYLGALLSLFIIRKTLKEFKQKTLSCWKNLYKAIIIIYSAIFTMLIWDGLILFPQEVIRENQFHVSLNIFGIALLTIPIFLTPLLYILFQIKEYFDVDISDNNKNIKLDKNDRKTTIKSITYLLVVILIYIYSAFLFYNNIIFLNKNITGGDIFSGAIVDNLKNDPLIGTTISFTSPSFYTSDCKDCKNYFSNIIPNIKGLGCPYYIKYQSNPPVDDLKLIYVPTSEKFKITNISQSYFFGNSFSKPTGYDYKNFIIKDSEGNFFSLQSNTSTSPDKETPQPPCQNYYPHDKLMYDSLFKYLEINKNIRVGIVTFENQGSNVYSKFPTEEEKGLINTLNQKYPTSNLFFTPWVSNQDKRGFETTIDLNIFKYLIIHGYYVYGLEQNYINNLTKAELDEINGSTINGKKTNSGQNSASSSEPLDILAPHTQTTPITSTHNPLMIQIPPDQDTYLKTLVP